MTIYLEKLKKSYYQRRQIKLPSIIGVFLFLNVVLGVVIIASLIFAPGNKIEYHFGEESGAITALSAIFLAIACGLAGSSFYLTEKKYKTKKAFWLLVMISFGFLAWDELMEGHEKIGYWIKNSWVGPSQSFRNWNDVVVVLYGIAALIFLACFLPTIMSYPKFPELLAIGFAFYVIHTAIDALTIDRTSMSVILEESCKSISSAYFAFAMFTGLLGTLMTLCSPTSK